MNRRFIYLGFLLSIVLISKQSISQDIHFSNLSMTQLYTSIGSVGGSTSLFSASTEYRNQWPTIGNAYTTLGMTAAGRIETKNGGKGVTKRKNERRETRSCGRIKNIHYEFEWK